MALPMNTFEMTAARWRLRRVIITARKPDHKEAPALAADGGDKPMLKRTRYILFKRPERRSEQDNDRLNALLAVNENLLTVDMLKDDLHQFWACRDQEEAQTWLEGWIDGALDTAIEPLRRFARGLRRSAHGILNSFKHRITSGPIEGFNNLISRAIHRACGIRDRICKDCEDLPDLWLVTALTGRQAGSPQGFTGLKARSVGACSVLAGWAAADRESAPRLADWLETNVPEGLTIFALRATHRRRLRTTNSLERLNKEIKR